MPSVSTLLAFDRWGVSYHAGYSADAAGWQILVAACLIKIFLTSIQLMAWHLLPQLTLVITRLARLMFP